MTSYLVLYMTMGAKLFGQGENARGLRLSPFGVLPHEIAALNAAARDRSARRRVTAGARGTRRAAAASESPAS